MYYLYAIKSKIKNYIYVGISNNVERRVNEHNKGKERTTRPYIPFDVIYTEIYKNRTEARLREKYFKSGSGKEFLKSI